MERGNWPLKIFVVILTFLVLVNFTLFFRLSILQRKKIDLPCHTEFDTKGNRQMETIRCGLIRQTESHSEFLGRLKDVYVDKNGLVRVEIEVLSPEEKLVVYKFVLGLSERSYTFVKIRREKTLFDTEGNFKTSIEKLEESFIRKFSKFKGNLLLFTLENGKDFLNAKMETTADEKYQEDIEFRKNYYERCQSVLTKGFNLPEIEKKCGYLYLNGLVLFKDNLEL